MSESNRYSRGKIYKIYRDDCDEVYIGSTTRSTLAQRLSEHVRGLKQGKGCASSGLVNRPGYTITLLELYPCSSKDELRAREQHYIETTVNTINKLKAFTGLSKTEYNQQYRLDHKEKLNEYYQQYRLDHKEQINEYFQQYHQDHKEKLNERRRQHRRDHKKQITIERSIKVTCECGRVVTHGAIWSHKKTKKHHTLLAAKATEQ